MRDEFEKKLFDMAAREQIILPKTLHDEINLELQRLETGRRKKNMLNFRRSLVLAAALIMLFSITAVAAAGALQQRMEAMNKEKLEEYFVQIHSSWLSADNYNRPYMDSEKERMEELRVSYEEQGYFPEGELIMIDEAEDYRGKNVAFLKRTSTFFFPEKEMSDEQLLQIIDFYAKREYSLQKMNEMIAQGEAEVPEKAMPSVPGKATDSSVLNSSGVFNPQQALTIPYTGSLSICAVAAGNDCILLAGRNAIHRMEIGSGDSVLFYDGFDGNTLITALCQDVEGSVYVGLIKKAADGNWKAGVRVIDGDGSFVREIDLSPWLKENYITTGGEGSNGQIVRMMADNNYLYLRGIGFQDANYLLIIDKEGNPVSHMTSDKYHADRLCGMTVGRDGKPYTVIRDENGRLGIASVNPKNGSLENIYPAIVPEDTLSLDLITPGYDADFVLWGYSGSFSFNLNEDAAELITPVYELPCPTEGALYLGLPDGRIVFAYCAEYRSYTTSDGEAKHERIPEKTCFYYLPGIRKS